MKPAGAVALLAGVLLTATGETRASPHAHETPAAIERLGITFAPPAATAGAPAANPTQPADSTPVVVLPKFDVHASRIDLEAHRLLTAKGLLAEAKRRELSPLYQTTLGPLAVLAAVYFNPLSLLMGVRANDAEAMLLFEQDERLRRLHEADSLIEIYQDEDPAAYKELKRELRDSFQLRSPMVGEH